MGQGEDLMTNNEKTDTQSATTTLVSKIREKKATVGVVGMGYVGLPLALLFARKGYSAVGFDIDPNKVEKLQRGESYILHIPADSIAEQVKGGRLRATPDFSMVREVDALLICVPTPLDEHREPDVSYIRNTAESVMPYLRPGQLIVLESTTYPGTTDELLLPILRRSGLRCPITEYTTDGTAVTSAAASESDFLVAFSPEREDPGNKDFRTHQIPKIVGGVNGDSAIAAQALYAQAFDRTMLVSTARAAEMTKLLENIYRCVNIALVNELKLLCQRMNINIWEVIEAAKTKPFGFTAFYPGPGLGGHCIPIDPFYLTWKAREYQFPTRFIELAGEINSAMPEHVVAATADALNERKQCLRDARILILGVAYKKDIDDLRESPSLRLIQLLRESGARVDYHDPYFPQLHKMRHYDLQMASVELTSQALSSYDAVVIATDHSRIDYAWVAKNSKLVIDTRNATRNVAEGRRNIVLC
jgi:UDP-N-acetyl-D-glucosamine dehydrogenase